MPRASRAPARPWLRAAAAALFVVVAGTGVGRAEAPVRDFFNVLNPSGADPWVFRHEDGRYYANWTTGGDVRLWRSPTLTGIAGGESKVLWTPPASGPKSRDIWAPELHRLRGKWYVYYAADDGQNRNHRMYALENDAADPFEGRFIDKGKVFDPSHDGWAIDGTALELGGKLYFLWSGWEGTDNVAQRLYIAPMSDPWTISGPRIELSRPDHDWEHRGGPPAINEGPQFLLKGDAVHIIYSAGGSWTDDYCLGRLTAPVGADLLNPASWRKSPTPVFRSGRGVLAPGHCSFTKSPDGREDWLVYHAAKYPGGGWDRSVRAQPFGWNADGTPRFGTPNSPDSPIALPGGEPARQRIEAEAVAHGGRTRVTQSPSASGREAVALDGPGGSLEFTIEPEHSGGHELALRFANATPDKAEAHLALTVNDGPARSVRLEYEGPGVWSSLSLRVDLKAGPNRIRITRKDHDVALDCLDVVPVP